MLKRWLHPSRDLLSRMADRMLDPKAERKLNLHLDGCGHCRRWVSAMEQVKRTLGGLPPIEGNPWVSLQPPQFIPVTPQVFSPWAVAAGITLGMALAALVPFRPVQPPMRIISGNTPVMSSGDQPRSELPSGAPLRSLVPGDVDFSLNDQIFFRIKPGSIVTWQELNRPWIFGGRPHVALNVMQGEVLARTKDSFWGSHLQVRTPTASATVKGTAFSVNVDSRKQATTLKVLAGSVFLSPYLGRIGINVQGGQMGRIEAQEMPGPPEALSADEREALLETYRIGQEPVVALVVGAGPERTSEMLQPALLFLSRRPHPQIQPLLRRAVRDLNQAILRGDLPSRTEEVRIVEMALQNVTAENLAVPLRLYVGSLLTRMGHPRRAIVHFQWVAERHPRHPLASIGLAAAATVAEKWLKEKDPAAQAFREILRRHPASPEASLAREFLYRIRATP